MPHCEALLLLIRGEVAVELCALRRLKSSTTEIIYRLRGNPTLQSNNEAI